MTSRAKATILDIAREAGVSKSTVSLVLQGSGLIRPETAVKVRKAIEDVGYVYNRGAANLRKAHSNVIGMVINDLTNPFFAELAVGMERVFQAAGIVPFIANTAENPVRQEEVLKSLLEQGVAGLIVSPARGTTPGAFRRIEAAGVPVVFAMRRLPESRIPAIAPDNHRGAYLATQHLIGKGHRRLAFFGGSSDLVVYHDRLGGFIEACEALGIPAANRTIVEGETSRRGGMACLEAGADFAVVGFDDVAEAEHYMPALTSVAVDTPGLGERAAHVMLKMIQSRTTRAEDHIGAVSLVVRESCGPSRSAHGTGMGDAA
ncbi:MAG: LacI family DNA-binding transcriptional regulator [Mesorhizobium sp.]|nr:MAG: LacI family DNA-binding transcriptional regulator [Mesorhizobium sp.]